LSFVRGHPLAKAALDQAVWDLVAQREGVSLAALLARPYAEGARARVKVGVSIGIQPSSPGRSKSSATTSTRATAASS
jgi:O-succinylbenzoate synthase